jgi:hypothetical protein
MGMFFFHYMTKHFYCDLSVNDERISTTFLSNILKVTCKLLNIILNQN